MSLRRTLAGAALLVVGLDANAASFDCTKAGTAVEHMICADSAVSSLDQRVVDAYKASATHDPQAKEAQREWLLDVRNKCTTTACLSQAYGARLSTLTKKTDKSGPCAITAATLVGSWFNAAESVDPFEEADFTSDSSGQGFVSFAHHAPLGSGKWTFESCRIHVAGSGAGNDYDYVVTGYSHGHLSLKDESDGSTLALKRAK